MNHPLFTKLAGNICYEESFAKQNSVTLTKLVFLTENSKEDTPIASTEGKMEHRKCG